LQADEPALLPVLEVDDDISAADILLATVLSNEEEAASSATALSHVEAEDPKPTDAPQLAKGHVSDIAGAARSPEKPVAQGRGAAPASPLPLVLIDADVTLLEWAKTALQADFSRIHAFQQAEQGLARVRQYLIRGEFPVVLISTKARIDPLSGIHGLSDFVSRLKAQATKLVVVGLQEEAAAGEAAEPDPQSAIRAFDRIVTRPSGQALRARGEGLRAGAGEAFALALHGLLEAKGEISSSNSKSSAAADAPLIRHLRNATTKLQDASSRGEILPVVLDFASEIFVRVAILIVRDEQVFAIAGRGIDALEVDPLSSSPPVSLNTVDGGWVRQVLDGGRPIEGPPATPADHDLLTRFGGVVPETSYLGPIASSGVTVAILYCDQAAAGQGEMPDTSGLEVVLQHAGLALDRAALERALWEVDARTD
jgi:hypothetical protein